MKAMKTLTTGLAVATAIMLLTPMAGAFPVRVYSQDGPQDPLFVQGEVHELGCMMADFPPDEAIECFEWWETTTTACPDEPGDDPQMLNMVVQIINRTNTAFQELYYVADPETGLTNFDGFVGNMGATGPEDDACLAFRIDHDGVNTPLQFESAAWDNVFEPGEVWNFIIQDYFNGLGGPPIALDSMGVAGHSPTWPPSTGSIITPEPATVVLLGLGAVGLVARRRRKK